MRIAKCCGALRQEGITVSISMHSSSETEAVPELLIWRGNTIDRFSKKLWTFFLVQGKMMVKAMILWEF